MATGLKRYEFSERLADILGESRRDLRFRVTLLVSSGLIPPGPRGPGSPPADPDYAAILLIGAMAAPQQAHTPEAIRCYRDLRPSTFTTGETAPRVVIGRPGLRLRLGPPPAVSMLLADRPPFGDALARLLDRAQNDDTRAALAQEVFGIWISRGFPAAAIQLAVWHGDRRALVTQRYEQPDGARPPPWLDPGRGGTTDPGLLHSVFLPARKLIEIGSLTTSQHERTPSVLDIGPTLSETITDLAQLARRRGQRRPWETFLEKAAAARTFADSLDRQTTRLTEVAEFGSNPGNLRMLTYVPPGLPDASPLVVVLHGCTQTAASFDDGVGWTDLADRYGFAVLLPEQRRRNNPLRCFNWFKREDTARDEGEALSIRQMVDRAITDHRLDASRVYITGLSAGGAMTSAMLATYPDVFAGGAVIAGVPYRCATGVQEAMDAIFQGRERPADEWGTLVRQASPHEGPWPKVSVWHGAVDGTVKPSNAEEIVKQWAHVHGIAPTPTVETFIDGHAYRVWRDHDDNDLIECYTITDMAHGAPIHPGEGEGQCGRPAPFIVDMGISSAYHIARFFGLTEPRADWLPVPARHRQTSVPPQPDLAAAQHADQAPGHETERRDQPGASETKAAGPSSAIDLQTILARTFETAAALRREHEQRRQRERGQGQSEQRDHEVPPTPDANRDDTRDATGGPRQARAAGGPLGIDIPSILTTSFQAAGLLKPDPNARPKSRPTGPLGIDVQQILQTSFEAAGLLRDAARDAGASTQDSPPRSPSPDAHPSAQQAAEQAAPPTPATPDTGDPAAPTDPVAGTTDSEEPRDAALEDTGWIGDGWRLLSTQAPVSTAAPGEEAPGASAGGASGDGVVLFGHASSGSEDATGNNVRSISCRLALGSDSPRLSYARRLDLRGGVNPFTKASFRVLIEGVAVDEVHSTGMDYAEAEWTDRKDVDLTPFAGRTVTLTFEVAARSNVFIEAFAKAWLRDIAFHDALRS